VSSSRYVLLEKIGQTSTTSPLFDTSLSFRQANSQVVARDEVEVRRRRRRRRRSGKPEETIN
jgi:hypothetical protein